VSAADDLAVLARVTASLIVVVALAVLAARFARKAGVRGSGAGLRVVERTGLSREASVAVVEVGGRGLVVGVTAQGVSLLTELTAAELAAATAASSEVGASLPASGDLPEGAAGARRIVVQPETPPWGTRPEGIRPEGTRSHGRRAATIRGTGSVLDPRTWRQAVEALRDLTARGR
jgi:flagellar biosynthetic protein FliO